MRTNTHYSKLVRWDDFVGFSCTKKMKKHLVREAGIKGISAASYMRALVIRDMEAKGATTTRERKRLEIEHARMNWTTNCPKCGEKISMLKGE